MSTPAKDPVRFLDKLQLHQVLRYLLAGGLFVATYVHTTGLPLFTESNVTFAIAGSLIAGGIIYSFHRSLLYPCVCKLVFVVLLRHMKPELSPKLPHNLRDLEIALDTARWKRRTGESDPIQTGYDEWGGQIHLMFCSALALFAGNAVAMKGYVGLIGPVQYDWLLIMAIFLFLIAGLVSDFRLSTRELLLLSQDSSSKENPDNSKTRNY